MVHRRFLLFLAFLIIVLSWGGIAAARVGLVIRPLESSGVPLLYVAPQNFGRKLPGVLIAHGFAGSKQLMLGYAHVLAHGGYAVMLWDFEGHGANPGALASGLQQNLNTAYAALLEQPEVDPSRLALLGHSMGSGAVMAAGIRHPDRFAATIAVSPTGAAVTPQAPHNLLLQAGSWEGRFVTNAQRLLQAAGGPSKNLSRGEGRALVIVPKAEHITILFRDASHQAALKWLNATFNQSGPDTYVDRRMLGYSLHLLGWLGVLGVVASRRVPATKHWVKGHPLRPWGGLIFAPLIATAGLVFISLGTELRNLGGLLVGGALGLWFLIAGLVWLGMLFPVPRPTLRQIGLGIALFGLLWVAFGAMAQVTWLQWWLIPARLKLWPLLSLACFPWFLASGMVQQRGKVSRRFLWWLGQSTALVVGLFLTIYLLPQLGFIFLLLPLFPLITAVLAVVAAQFNEAWSYAVGSALFFGWIIAAAFPLA